MALEGALVAEDPQRAAAIIQAEAGASIARFEEALPAALAGGFPAVLVLTRTWNSLLDEALETASSSLKGTLVADRELTVHGERVPWLKVSLRAAVAEAPFSRFVSAFGPGLGMAVACLAKIRESIAELPPLPLPASGLPRFEQPIDILRLHRLVDLAIRGMAPPIERLQEALGLSTSELGEVFGVSRQAIDQWRIRGIPPERRAKTADLLAVVDLLDRKLKPGRLPLVARRPASAFGGRSLLEVAAAGQQSDLRQKVEQAFDWSTAA